MATREALSTRTPVVETVLALKEHHCRYPIGHVGDRNFRFCRKPRRSGSYCDVHARRCYDVHARRWG